MSNPDDVNRMYAQRASHGGTAHHAPRARRARIPPIRVLRTRLRGPVSVPENPGFGHFVLYAVVFSFVFFVLGGFLLTFLIAPLVRGGNKFWVALAPIACCLGIVGSLIIVVKARRESRLSSVESEGANPDVANGQRVLDLDDNPYGLEDYREDDPPPDAVRFTPSEPNPKRGKR